MPYHHTQTLATVYNETIISPIALVFVIVMIILIIVLKKEKALIPLIFVACYITDQQRISIAGIDFNMIRILLLVLLGKVILKKEWKIKTFNSLDKIIIVYVILNVILNSILFGTFAGVINRLGFAFDRLCAYLLIRNYISDFDGINTIIEWSIIASILVSVAMLNEQITGKNIFSFLGGVPEETIIRKGRLRSQGAFAHAIMAGTYGASLFPLIWGYARHHAKKKKLVIIGYCTTIIITLASNSSGPIFTLLGAIGALFLWNFRQYLSLIRKIAIGGIIGLEIVMEQHVWHLIGRAAIVEGSTGFHRFRLIDAFIDNIWEWFLIGTTQYMYWGRGLHDITNQFVLEGVRGGIVNLTMFIIIIATSFRYVGRNIQHLKDENLKKYSWAFGTALFSHCVSFIGVSYFGQMLFFLFLLFALIASFRDITEKSLKKQNNSAAD